MVTPQTAELNGPRREYLAKDSIRVPPDEFKDRNQISASF